MGKASWGYRSNRPGVGTPSGALVRVGSRTWKLVWRVNMPTIARAETVFDPPILAPLLVTIRFPENPLEAISRYGILRICTLKNAVFFKGFRWHRYKSGKVAG